MPSYRYLTGFAITQGLVNFGARMRCKAFIGRARGFNTNRSRGRGTARRLTYSTLFTEQENGRSRAEYMKLNTEAKTIIIIHFICYFILCVTSRVILLLFTSFPYNTARFLVNFTRISCPLSSASASVLFWFHYAECDNRDKVM